jgi:hypothetical protein
MRNIFKINVKGIILSFGGATPMRVIWARCGLHLTKGAQDKWVMRQALPTARILEVVQVSKILGIDFDLNFFVEIKKRSNPNDENTRTMGRPVLGKGCTRRQR